MKSRIALSAILSILLHVAGLAQTIDIKDIVDKSPSEIIALFGEPAHIDTNEYFMCDTTLLYDDVIILFMNSAIDNRPQCDGITISKSAIKNQSFCKRNGLEISDKLCILTDYIEGGLKLGDSLERLRSVDFVNTEYGRGRPENKLKKSQGEYVAYQAENCHFYFRIEDGMIQTIIYAPPIDADPNNTNSYSILGKSKK